MRSNKRSLRKDHIIRCSVHTLQIAVKSTMTIMAEPISIVRAFIKRVRSTKTLRASWHDISLDQLGKKTEPPIPDTPTRWNSTWKFSKLCVERQSVIVHVNTIAPVKTGAATLESFTESDWSKLKACNEFLEKPAKV